MRFGSLKNKGIGLKVPARYKRVEGYTFCAVKQDWFFVCGNATRVQTLAKPANNAFPN